MILLLNIDSLNYFEIFGKFCILLNCNILFKNIIIIIIKKEIKCLIIIIKYINKNTNFNINYKRKDQLDLLNDGNQRIMPNDKVLPDAPK